MLNFLYKTFLFHCGSQSTILVPLYSVVPLCSVNQSRVMRELCDNDGTYTQSRVSLFIGSENASFLLQEIIVAAIFCRQKNGVMSLISRYTALVFDTGTLAPEPL